MGLSWQQGPLAPGAVGKFLVPQPLPERLLYVEPLRRRMRVRFGGTWIADSEDVILLFEPARYPVTYFRLADVAADVLKRTEHTATHRDLGPTSWYIVQTGEHSAPRGAWQHTALPAHAGELEARVAFSWSAMEAFYEEDERVKGHAAAPYHRIEIRQSSRNLVVRHGDRVVADTRQPIALYESGFAPRWYVPLADIDPSALTLVERQTFCPYKGMCSYFDVGDARFGAWRVSRGLFRRRTHFRFDFVRTGQGRCLPRWQAAPSRTGADRDLAWSGSRPDRCRGIDFKQAGVKARFTVRSAAGFAVSFTASSKTSPPRPAASGWIQQGSDRGHRKSTTLWLDCYRVGIRTNEPRMPALLTSSGRPGFYFRVLQEGVVTAGDEIVKVGEAKERMSVKEINALLYLPDHERAQLERALQIDALSPGWRWSFKALLDSQSQSGGSARGNAGLAPGAAARTATPGFRPLVVTAMEEESVDVLSLTMRSPSGSPLEQALPGQYVVLRLRT